MADYQHSFANKLVTYSRDQLSSSHFARASSLASLSLVAILALILCGTADAGRLGTSKVSDGNASTLTDRPGGSLEQTLGGYIRNNYASLNRQAAQAYGEHLLVISAILGVPVHRRNDFYSQIQQQWQPIFADRQSNNKRNRVAIEGALRNIAQQTIAMDQAASQSGSKPPSKLTSEPTQSKPKPTANTASQGEE